MSSPQTPLLVAIDMGYGHLRPAHALAGVLGAPVLHLDRPPIGDENDRRAWARARTVHEGLSRLSQSRFTRAPARAALEALTFIPPLEPGRDLSPATLGVRALDRMAASGLGRRMIEELRNTGAPLLTTFYAPAVIADRAGIDRVFCVVTDSDINRVWAPVHSSKTRIQYFAPSELARRRLEAYGVPAGRIEVTGYPLPGALLGGPDLAAARENLAARLVRLDPHGTFLRAAGRVLADGLGDRAEILSRGPDRPMRLLFAVGGAGAQAHFAHELAPALAPMIRSGRLALTLVAGIRPEVAETFSRALAAADLASARGVEILHERTMEAYLSRFEERLADTDVLFTKPSEMTFFAALGLPLLLAPAVGVHETKNAQWALEAGAAVIPGELGRLADQIVQWLDEGTLARAAWSGFTTLPRHGLYRIADAVGKKVAT